MGDFSKESRARVIIACDFCIAATATFRILYVLVVMEHASRRLIQLSATAHPTAAWTLQQLREPFPPTTVIASSSTIMTLSFHPNWTLR